VTTSSSVLLPPGGQRILFVLAHPDDGDFISGGTVARLAEEGKDVHYLVVTRGDAGGNPDIREQEQYRSAELLGVKTVTFLNGYADGEIEPTISLRRDIAFIVRQWRPDVVFTFDPWKRYDMHPDHRAVGQCTQDALVNASAQNFPEQLVNGVVPHKAKHLYYFSTDKPNHWVDTSSVIERKIAAMRCHESQMSGFNPDEYARRKGREAGMVHKYKLAEAFHHDVI
jgi:LmbE family N-acetylglucosaminyl deacetylase